MTAAGIAALIGQGRYDLTDEKRCQADIERLLAAEDIVFSREHRLGPRDIPDFLVEGGILIEVKMRAAGQAAALRQLGRYAGYEEVEALILAANRPVSLPAEIGDKPVLFVSLGSAWL